jgi:cytochrome c oxidase subunit IV
MNHDTNVNPEAHAEHHGDMVKTIWRTFWIMLIVTIVEIIGALLYPHSMPRMPLNIFFIVMSLLKAYYIVAVFMHLKFEKKALATTILLPTLFLVYAIIVMLVEGDYWLESVINY